MTSYAARVLITNLLLSWGLFIQFFERKPAFPKYAKNTYRIRNVAIYKSNCSPVPHYARKIIGDKTLFLRFCLRLRFVMQTKIFKNTFQTRGVSFTKTGSGSVDGKHFENGGTIQWDWSWQWSCDFPPRVFLKQKSRHTIVRFQFLQRNLDRALAEWNTRRERASDFLYFVKIE